MDSSAAIPVSRSDAGAVDFGATDVQIRLIESGGSPLAGVFEVEAWCKQEPQRLLGRASTAPDGTCSVQVPSEWGAEVEFRALTRFASGSGTWTASSGTRMCEIRVERGAFVELRFDLSMLTPEARREAAGTSVRLACRSDSCVASSPDAIAAIDADGCARFRGLPEGGWELYAVGAEDRVVRIGPRLVLDPVALWVRPGEEYVVDVPTLPRAPLRGRVVGPEGQPIVGARLGLTLPVYEGGAFRLHAWEELTDAVGAFEFPAVPERAGTLSLERADVPAREIDPERVSEAWRSGEELRIEVTPERTVDVLVRLPDGRPVALAGVRVGAQRARLAMGSPIHTDDHGRARVALCGDLPLVAEALVATRELSGYAHVVRALHPALLASRTPADHVRMVREIARDELPESGPIELRLAPVPMLSGRVNGVPLDAQGVFVAARPAWSDPGEAHARRRVELDASGNFAFRLLPTTWILEAGWRVDGRDITLAGPVEVELGPEDTLQDLTVPPCGAIEMQLVASDGTPLAGLGVVLNRIDRAAGQGLHLFQTAHDGTFRWSNLAPGKYEIRPWAEDFVFDPVEVDIEPGGRAVDLRVVATAAGFIEVTLPPKVAGMPEFGTVRVLHADGSDASSRSKVIGNEAKRFGPLAPGGYRLTAAIHGFDEVHSTAWFEPDGLLHVTAGEVTHFALEPAPSPRTRLVGRFSSHVNYGISSIELRDGERVVALQRLGVDGEFQLATYGTGSLELLALADEWRPLHSWAVAVEEGETLDLGEVALPSGAIFVERLGAIPWRNARAFRLGDGDVRGPEIASDPIPYGATDGGFGFEALAAGRYLIEVLRDAQVLGSTIVEVVEGRTTYLRP